VLDASAGAARRLLTGCKGLKVLATSRQPLGIAGECAWRVPSLDLPPDSMELPEPRERRRAASFLDYEAVRLFVERASQAKSDFEVTPDNAGDIASICRKLDGIPLAIELAAARARALSTREILERLNRNFGLLTGSDRTAASRHQTIHATIAWSLDPLDPSERELLQNLTVFAGGCGLEAAEAVSGSTQPGEEAIIDRLTALVDKSLVIHSVRGGLSWFRLLETVREQAGEELSPERRQALRYRHAEHYLQLVLRYIGEAEQAAFADWSRRFDIELDNLRLAIGQWIGVGEADNALGLSMHLHRYWSDRGLQSEGRRWIERSLQVPGSSARSRASAHKALGLLIFQQKQLDQARAVFEEGLRLYESLGDVREAASMANDVGTCAYEAGLYDEAERFFGKALAVNRELGLDLCVAMNLGNLGHVADDLGDFNRAMELFEEGLALTKQAGADRIVPGFLGAIGATLRKMGEAERAGAALREGLSLAREQGAVFWQPLILDNLGMLAVDSGEFEDAYILHSQSLALVRKSGDRRAAAASLEGIASLYARERRDAEAARLLGAASALRQSINAPLSPSQGPSHEALTKRLKRALGERGFAAAEAEGRAETFESAIAMALQSGLEPPSADPARSAALR
jgi:non-specific serine/threonine protein kinase